MPRISQTLREKVRRRAHERCEYCRLPDSVALSPFHIEHIISIKHHGTTDLHNLAWACLQCNLCKGSDVGGYDLSTGELTPLFNPRQQQWQDHFQMQGATILGITSIGRATVDVLQMNAREQIAIRQSTLRKKTLVKLGFDQKGLLTDWSSPFMYYT